MCSLPLAREGLGEGKLIERWQAVLDHPILRLELRRIRRKRWWPGRRFFMFYPALLGAAVGYGVALALSDSLGVQVAALATGLPVVCLVSVVTSLLSFALPWIAPALTAATIARERELGTLDLLRATLLTERSIVLGKLAGCLARLWPGLLALALLSPFQVVWMAGSSLFAIPSSLNVLTMGTGFAALMMDVGFDTNWQTWALVLVLAVLTVVPGLLKPWCDLALNAAVGLFVSVRSPSSGAAIAISYGAILVVRVALWLGTSVLWPLLLMLVGTAQASLLGTTLAMQETAMMLVIPGLVLLATVFVEAVGAASLVWGAIWWLKRT
jgi:hypothetical protein